MGLDPTQNTGSIFTYSSFSRKIFRAPAEKDGGYYDRLIDGADTISGEYPRNANTCISPTRARNRPGHRRDADEKYLFSVCQLNEQARCFSTRPYFAEKIAKGETFKSGGHWEPEGHLAVAEDIKRYLVDQGYVTAP